MKRIEYKDVKINLLSLYSSLTSYSFFFPSSLEKPLIQRFFAYNVFFRRACQRKNERCGVNAAKIKF